MFAHNGYVNREHLFGLLKDKFKRELKGETDSEVYFYWILQCIEECGEVLDGIKKAIGKIISECNHTGLNFLLSDGKSLYAFRYSHGSISYYSLYSLKREPSGHGLLEFQSQETKALLRSKSLRGEKAVLVCSEKLTGESWKEIGFGNLIEIRDDLSMNEVRYYDSHSKPRGMYMRNTATIK